MIYFQKQPVLVTEVHAAAEYVGTVYFVKLIDADNHCLINSGEWIDANRLVANEPNEIANACAKLMPRGVLTVQ
jgi:hypothetical protein